MKVTKGFMGIAAVVICAAIVLISVTLIIYNVVASDNLEILLNGEKIAVSASADSSKNRDKTAVSVSGYSSKSGDIFIIESEDTFSVVPPRAEKTFNKYHIGYSASVPLKGEIILSNGSAEEKESFYLEAGENLTFSSFIDGYLNSEKFKSITKIGLELIQNSPCEFSLKTLSMSEEEVLTDNVVYLETDRYKLGINLMWGGGISYLEDKKDADPEITNLLNNHDTGRLVQQSYYGTLDDPDYKPSKFNGNLCPYNPVQGGDQHNTHSKIIDYKVEEDYIYIKNRAKDWAKKNSLTQSYMENIYKIDGEVINVYNSFIDFSNYDNPKTSQEMPAFYTISYLGNFVCYNGDKPWTDDTLEKHTNIGWSAEERYSFNYSDENTEKWSAWVDDNDWGIGLFVPNVDSLVAARSMYDGSKYGYATSTNYTAPVKMMALYFGEKIEYSYLITTGTVDEIRAKFKANKDFTDNASLSQTISAEIDPVNIRFDNNDSMRLFNLKNQANVERVGDFAKLFVTKDEANDPYIQFDYTMLSESASADEYPYLVVTYRAPKTNSKANYTTEFFLGAGDVAAATPDAYMRTTTDASDHFASHILDLSDKGFWTGKVNFVRFDFFTESNTDDSMYIYSVRLAKTEQEAKAIAAEEAAVADKKAEGIIG